MSAAPMHIAFAADANYVPHAAAMAHSVLAQHPHRTVTFHLVRAEGMPADALAKLASVIEGAGGTLHDVVVPAAAVARFKPHRTLGVTTYLRILIPALLPHLDRVLYLDCDLIACAPLDEVWDAELGTSLVGAVTNVLYPHQSRAWLRELGLPGEDQYFNGGVLLMNLAGWRAEGTAERMGRWIETNEGPMPFGDQDPLNALLWQRRLALPARFNVQNPWFDLPPRDLPAPPATVRELRRRPAIVHFSGMMKPWLHACGHPLRHLYHRHLAATPWRGSGLQQKHWRNVFLRHAPYRLARWYWRLFKPPRLKR